ncbi:hypothetical protein GCM10010472_01480 [Pseudonocardia halophobica]|uniref:DUF4913 domain-containing protein n=1 Tax=Pseudonocardia halophobica TaxID=29401 RepID=A0A9W6KZY9_9PSEU|nr:DUF4913 domain-containing protein [Pseudonocardia halophobica]GLL10488.1 hypothetical protein GCM10017577_16280 [Pseudonocardia halophobica]
MTDLDELLARVERLENVTGQHTDLLDDVVNGPRSEPPPPPAKTAPQAIDPDELADWVRRHVTSVIARPIRGELRWCPRWWEHSEALFRFEALRRAWTELAAEPGTAMSVWIRDHLDPCLRELQSPTGPFADCDLTERFGMRADHAPLATLQTTPYRP